jgi:phosphoribosyl 1,2-cyclic phosphate phosphodiesterase
MEITFLGTGTSGGVPLIGCQCEVCKSTDPRDKRLRTAILIKANGLNLVTDCGPDFRQQMLREDVRKLDGILMTHPHKDHTAGLDDIRAYNFIDKKPVDIYCDGLSEAGIREQYSYIFQDTDYPYLPRINFIHIDKQPFKIGELEILPFEVMHAAMPVKGYRIGNFTYITDAKTITPKEKTKLKGTKILVVNALRPEPHYSHLNIEEALQLVDEIKPEKTYLIHMSHQFGLHAEAHRKLPKGVIAAYDGLKIEV